jgi:indolepyruvate ferredoxin oxidoreductase beta subunit
MRGFVTPDKTTLIGSTHRALAVSEKTVPGDGIADSAEVRAAAEIAAKSLLLLDLEQIATQTNSVISASLFGALCASGALPFKRQAFEEAVRSSGKGVRASIQAFELAINTIQSPEVKITASTELKVNHQPTGPVKLLNAWSQLRREIDLMPIQVQGMVLLGLKKIVDFQNIKYGNEYINKIKEIISKDSKKADFEFSREAAKYLANAMSYDDLIRVADLKTRQSRMDRINIEMKVDKAMRLKLTEYFHPRAEEVVGLFPKNIGKWFEESAKRMKLLNRLVNKGRRLKSTSLPAFFVLFSLGGLRSYRTRTWRHEVERIHREAWLEVAFAYLPKKYNLAVEIIKCRRLIKGYSDTHARGLSKFDRVLYGAKLVADRDDAAKWVDRLRNAALADENGEDLEGAIKTIQTIL